jgi:hypothetical protein
MISLNIVIIVVAAPPMDHLVAAEKAYQEIKAINDRQEAEFAARVAAVERNQVSISCSCGWTRGYATPGRAKMGLSGHQKACRRK